MQLCREEGQPRFAHLPFVMAGVPCIGGVLGFETTLVKGCQHTHKTYICALNNAFATPLMRTLFYGEAQFWPLESSSFCCKPPEICCRAIAIPCTSLAMPLAETRMQDRCPKLFKKLKNWVLGALQGER